MEEKETSNEEKRAKKVWKKMKMKQAMKQVTWGIATQAKKNENKEIGESCVQTPHLQSKSILSHQHQQ